MNKLRPYIIYAGEYKANSGGSRVLWGLAKSLVNSGFIVLVSNDKSSIPKEVLDQAIVIYPERISGNPLESKRVVRFILMKIGYFDKEKPVYSENDLIFYDTEILGTPNLFIPTIERDLFNDNHKLPRKFISYYIGKQFKDGDRDNEKIDRIRKSRSHNEIEITSDYPPERVILAGIFKESKWFYCYDNYSLLPIEAVLCGCPTIIIPNGDIAHYELMNGMTKGYGIAFGDTESEKKFALTTLPLAQKAYDEYLEKHKNDLNYFIGSTQAFYRNV